MYTFNTYDHVYAAHDELVHYIGHATPSIYQWATICLQYDDWWSRNQLRGRIMRTSGPTTCLWCMIGFVKTRGRV